MTTTAAVAALLGTGIAAGLLLFGAGLRKPASTVDTTSRWRDAWERLRDEVSPPWRAAAVAAGVLVAWVTGWPVAGMVVALTVAFRSRLFGRLDHAGRVARIEAIAAWTDMLRDTLSAAAGLEQAIIATADTAPDPIRVQVRELVVCLRRGDPLPEALRGLAADLADPTADLILSALVLASQHQARHLTALLGELASEARAQVAMRRRIEAGRARTRTSVRVIVGAVLVFAAGLVALNRGYLTPYDGPTGQLLLAVIAAIFAGSFGWLQTISRITDPPRVLTNLPATQPRRKESA